MDEAVFARLLTSGCAGLGIDLEEGAERRLHHYFLELKKWSRKVNLIARDTGDDQIVENHFLDSLTLLPLVAGHGARLLDVGSGAGFPGLAVAAAMPGLECMLVEPRLKRVSFLRQVVRSLHLDTVRVLACRVEDETALPSGTAPSHIVSRAVTEIGPFLELVGRFSRPGGVAICMKGPRWREELERAAEQLEELPFILERVVEHRLPFSGAERALLVFGHRG